MEDADILYIGKAGGVSINGVISQAMLRERIKALFRFGNNEPVAHWGGRYLWQHEESENFLIYWFDASKDNYNPVELEKQLIKQFEQNYGKKPFANLR